MNKIEAKLRSWAGSLRNGAYRARVLEAADEIRRLDALAAAAPDLLALLQRFYAATYGKTDLIPPLDFEQARAAIAKAEGRP